MIPIIQERENGISVTYARCFEWRNDPGAGFSFECDEHGTIVPSKHESGRENLRKCLTGEYDVIDKGIVTYRSRYSCPAIGRCTCGAEVVLSQSDNDCEKCGAIYNSFGQRLAPREHWGEETGESLADIYNGKSDE